MAATPTQLDFEQAIQLVTDDATKSFRVNDVVTSGIIEADNDPVNNALRVETINSLVTVPYNEIDLTYVPSGNGLGQVQTAIYKLASVTVATLTLTYDGSNRLISVVKT